ncbi:pseudouridine synthase [Buchnera aphidicola]|uniref:Pseudouridine synthase n=1 Tax=Buchnera aphidicola str. Ua (Uroleucon ambrosiae) TaxID=1005057 RepID=G2LPE3_BUCUM|nr:pseudouridine synthase [Buchnera aphidicola]AEO08080.1 23S rRNA pseudouridine 2605 synthase [Buchnera aphidicola str. Ua (Uroleucon ambrosiae)]
MSEKIQKFLSHLGYASRRGIEKMILNESISLNGKKVIIGQRVNCKNPGQIIIKGKMISIKNNKFKTKVILYNKPEGEICTKHDTKNRNTVFNKLPLLDINRWVSVGRLDINTTGLLLFTNNGHLANKLMHPKNNIEREYYIRVFGNVDNKIINILKHGVKIKTGYAAFKSIEPMHNRILSQNKWFKAVLCEGKNREIRYMWQKVKCQVNRLIRVRYGNIVLPKTLKPGHWIKVNSVLLDHLFKLTSFQE